MAKKRKRTVALDGTVFSGSLAEFIKIREPDDLYKMVGTVRIPNFEKSEIYEKKLSEARQKKFLDLFELFKIDVETFGPNVSMMMLAWALACATVPGFQREPRGRRRVPISDDDIVSTINAYMSDNNCSSLDTAIRHLRKRGKAFSNVPLTASAIRSRYTHAIELHRLDRPPAIGALTRRLNELKRKSNK